MHFLIILISAGAAGHLDIVEVLLKNRASVDIMDDVS